MFDPAAIDCMMAMAGDEACARLRTIHNNGFVAPPGSGV